MLQLKLLKPAVYCVSKWHNLRDEEIEHLLLTLRMKVYPANFALNLVEADIVEPFKARTRNRPDAMVGH